MSIYNNLLKSLLARNNKYFFLGLALIAIISLAYAFFVEYILGFEPCVLCLYQRVPYFVLIILSIAGSIYKNNKIILVFLLLTIFSAICVSGYHTGVERGVFNPTVTCNMGIKIPDNMDLDDVRELLYNATIASCTVPAYKIMKISMTEWNLIMNICLMIMVSMIIQKNRSK